MRPYTNIKTSKNTIIREFNENIDPTELLWHRDLESRKITILEGNGWYFQKDNELPFEMKKGNTIFIPELSWHRIIKGNTTLTIKIQE
jgi:quercetin dioxygenase-like cupin family protein